MPLCRCLHNAIETSKFKNQPVLINAYLFSFVMFPTRTHALNGFFWYPMNRAVLIFHGIYIHLMPSRFRKI
ncbi:sodium:proton antiporter [uncultured Tolumonas sp.]|uniref:sodium:proton antiporter n=1 Tax=uncultured Tolumonas sp. TaxID=263765 RepID=UPI00374A64A2